MRLIRYCVHIKLFFHLKVMPVYFLILVVNHFLLIIYHLLINILVKKNEVRFSGTLPPLLQKFNRIYETSYMQLFSVSIRYLLMKFCFYLDYRMILNKLNCVNCFFTIDGLYISLKIIYISGNIVYQI